MNDYASIQGPNLRALKVKLDLGEDFYSTLPGTTPTNAYTNVIWHLGIQEEQDAPAYE